MWRHTQLTSKPQPAPGAITSPMAPNTTTKQCHTCSSSEIQLESYHEKGLSAIPSMNKNFLYAMDLDRNISVGLRLTFPNFDRALQLESYQRDARHSSRACQWCLNSRFEWQQANQRLRLHELQPGAQFT